MTSRDDLPDDLRPSPSATIQTAGTEDLEEAAQELTSSPVRTVRTTGSGDLSLFTSVPPYPRRTILGLPVDACSIDQMVGTVEAWVDEGGRCRTATGVNAHVVNMAARRPQVRSLLEANDVNYVDGMSVVWAGRRLGLDVPERVATTDLVYPLVTMCSRRGFGVFLLGGTPGIVELAADRLRASYPRLQVDAHHGYFEPSQDGEVVAAINASGARVVLVGMGDPLQLEWVHEHRDLVAANVLLTCGGLFDWVSGVNLRPPRWMISSGLEWLWRVYLEPRRLGRRYLVGNPEFMLRFTADALRRRRSLADS